MASLQMLKPDGNPIKFPPKELFEIQASTPPTQGQLSENEVTEVGVTAHIKKFLKQVSQERSQALNGRVDVDTGGDESSEGTETPRPLLKRVTSGRFPVKVNGTDIPDLRSPSISRPPPIPTRSHYRGLSQQNSGAGNNNGAAGAARMRKLGVMPLTISGNVNERVRSNSETLLQARERSEGRQRRLLAMSKKASDLGTLDETQANNRFSHYRGLSHGSAMQGSSNVGAVQSPASPADPALQRPMYVRRLSVLPERRRDSNVADTVIEMARGLLYAVFQTHPMIQNLLGVFSDGSKRSSIEIVLFNTNSHVEELEQEIIRHDEEDPSAPTENTTVMHACQTVLGAYVHVCGLLTQNVRSLVDNADPRYIRTLFTYLNHSAMEIRATLATQGDSGYRIAAVRAAYGDTIRPHSRENSVTRAAERPGLRSRSRPGGAFVNNPSNLRVATDVALGHNNGNGRTAIIASPVPRSGESFSSNMSGRGLQVGFSEQDRVFERIFLSLQRSSEKVMLTLPYFRLQFMNGYRLAMNQQYGDLQVRWWKTLYERCQVMLNQTDALKGRLSAIKLKDPEVRNQPVFWGACRDFIEAWTDLISKIKDSVQYVNPPGDTRSRLRPIQQSMKDTNALILQSPWGFYLRAPNAQSLQHQQGHVAPLPMTPQSAALGPAVQATVPSTPQSGSFTTVSSVFERADTMISMGGLSVGLRSGTMMSTASASSGTSLGSMSSMNSMMNEPSSTLSPGPVGGPSASFRYMAPSKLSY